MCFTITQSNGYSLTTAQENFLNLTFSKLIASSPDMRTTLANADIHLEGSDFREITIDEPEKIIKELEEMKARLHDELRNCKNDRNSEAIARKEKELTDVMKRLDALHRLDGNVYKEILLGSYHYDHTIQKGVITLYVNNINKAAKSLPWRSDKQGLEYLTGYVFAHEAYHAYYDANHSRTVVNEIEEPMAEFGALAFLKDNGLPNFDLALSEVKRKKYSPCWTSAYGFGEYVYFQKDKSLIGTYRNNNASHPLVSKYQAGFANGYPWGKDEVSYDLLYQIITGKKSRSSKRSNIVPSLVSLNQLFDIMRNIALKRVDNIKNNPQVILKNYYNGINLTEQRYSDILDILNKIKAGSPLSDLDALILLFPKSIIVKTGPAQVIYDAHHPALLSANPYKITQKKHTNEIHINSDVFYIFPNSSTWNDHKLDLIYHIIRVMNILDNSGQSIFFDKDDVLNVVDALKNI